MINDIVFRLGQGMILAGLIGALGVQAFMSAKLVRSDVPRALAALVVPFYAVHRALHSEVKMPRVKTVWTWGVFVFVLGYFVKSIGMDL